MTLNPWPIPALKEVSVPPVSFAGGRRVAIIAGPCVAESRELCLHVARTMKGICDRLGVGYIFKASYDKANRTSRESYRGPGAEEGLVILAEVRETLGIPTLTDVHEVAQVKSVSEAVDVLQIPAFLCRQTDLLFAAGESGRAVNVKKGQFLAPWDMKHVVEKVRSTGNERILLTERGSSFGYGNLVVDFRGFSMMRELGCPVVYDATHSLQLPGAEGNATGGLRRYAPDLIRAAVAAGVDGLFLEVHPDPPCALSDATTVLPLDQVEAVLKPALEIDAFVKGSRGVGE
ncbi:MAG: 3-deoxy-8-phosphooctulonate synthase [Armatimonadetes bacterium]|nr:3-deoxy-8-phosphooctulonate synthase [Armatimonadota bacterium]